MITHGPTGAVSGRVETMLKGGRKGKYGKDRKLQGIARVRIIQVGR